MAKIVGKTLGMVGYGTGGLGTNNWAADMEANLRKIDAILQAGAVAIQNAPPGSPVDGQVYVVGTSPTGTWATQANAIARWNAAGNAWEFFTPAAGWWIAVGGTDYRWSGSAWVAGWAGPALPMESYSTLGLGLFGGAGKPTAYAYQILSNRGVGFQDSRGLSWRGGFVSTDEFYGPWQDASASTSMKPYIIGDGTGAVYYKHDPLDASFKHYFTGAARFSAAVNVVGAIQQNGVDAVTATREGRFTGMRLSNMGSGQIPVSSDANGQITASGLTDDGTFLGISRTIRAWNSMARSGNTWTDLQWNQDTQERVSIFSSNGSGVGAYHTMTLVPADAEVSGRGLGVVQWGQKVSGKSGVNPGLKAAILADSVGVGGSAGGYGGKLRIRYRSDNGNDLADALRVGAFGPGTADAVEAAILLRANAGLKIGGLSGAGNLYADSNGNVSVVSSQMFRAAGVVPTYNGVEQSVLGQTSAKRQIPANTINTGDELELICDFKSKVDGNAQTWNFYLGPDATYTASYRPSFTFSNQQLGTPTAWLNHRIVFLVRFTYAAPNVTARGRMTIERSSFDAYNSGFTVAYSTDFTIVFDRSLDRYADLTAIINPANASEFEHMVVSATYRKAG